jgi:hypothetical protein
LALAFVAFLILVLVETAALVGHGESPVISAADTAVNPVQNTPAAAVVAAQSSVDDPPTDLSASAIEVVSGPPPKIIASFEPSPFIPADESAAEKPAATPPKDDRPVPPAQRWTAEKMQALLTQIPEVWLQPPGVVTIPRTGRVSHGVHPTLKIIEGRPDLQGLALRPKSSLVLQPADSDAFRDVSIMFRKEMSEFLGRNTTTARVKLQPEVLVARPDVAARVMNQMLQAEAVPLRKILVNHLKKMHNPSAVQALVQRAVYEPVESVRQAAVQALGDRPVSEYLPTLIEALRIPWAPAADHAADALIALAPAGAVPELIRCLDGPDPAAVYQNPNGIPTVRELVSINHSRNCLLCHAQSTNQSDGVRVAVPSPARPLPAPFTLDTYQGGGRGGSRSGSNDGNSIFVRPDITYVQQEFSWVLPVEQHGLWPSLQRYDFVIRTRPATKEESTAIVADSPQRAAMVRALRALTGKDFGAKADDWRTGLGAASKGE